MFNDNFRKYIRNIGVNPQNLSAQEMGYLNQEAQRLANQKKRTIERIQRNEILQKVTSLDLPVKENILEILASYRIKDINTELEKGHNKTLFDLILDIEDKVYLPLIKLLLEMGASPQHIHLDYSIEHARYINAAEAQKDSHTISFFAAHHLGYKSDFPNANDKALWEISQVVKAGFNFGWRKLSA